MWWFVPALARPDVAAEMDAVVEPYRDALIVAAAAATLDGDHAEDLPVLGELLMHERLAAERTVHDLVLADVPRDPKGKGKVVTAFLKVLESAELHDADKLAFGSTLDDLAAALAAAPAGKARDALVARVTEDQQALTAIEDLYREEMRKILGQLTGTRGMTLTRERWDAYLAAIGQDRSAAAVFAAHAADLDGNAAASRGAAADNAYEIYGTSLPDKTFVLTFDDGPDPARTAAILDLLAARKVHAVFFEVGQNVGTEGTDGKVTEGAGAALTHRLLREGHLLGNHTWSHANLPAMTDAQVAEQIDKSDRVLDKVAGTDVALFRPPYGSRNPRVLAQVAERSQRAYLWNVDSRDWADPIPESIAQTVYEGVKAAGHGVILMHDVHPQTVAALPMVLDLLARDGYQLVLYDGDRVVGDTAAPATVGTKAPLYGASWAVLIGIDQYQRWPKLAYAVNDAEGVREALVDDFGFAEDHVITLLDGEATRERILRVLGDELPRKVGPDDRVFVFWAGHGATRELPGGGQRGYLIPVDADTSALQTAAISMTELQDVQEGLAAKHVWFVTDACYSGLALTRGAAGSYDPQRYLSEVTRRKARQILTAGGADEQVADHGPNGHSIFTYTLLQGLSGAADLNGDGYVTASEVGSFVPPRVSGLSKQTPVFGSLVGSEGGDFVLQLREGQELLSDATAPAAATDPTMLDRARALLAAENDELKRQLASMRSQLDQFTASRGAGVADPKADAARLHALGLQSYRAGRLAEAVEALSKAMDLDPGDVEIVNNLGYLRQKLGDHAAALPLFEKAVKLDPERAVAYVNLGDSLAALGRGAEAAAAYRKYLELFPGSPRRKAIEAWLAAHP